MKIRLYHNLKIKKEESMANYAKNRSKLIGICALGAVVCLGAAGGPLLADALTQTSTTDLIAKCSAVSVADFVYIISKLAS